MYKKFDLFFGFLVIIVFVWFTYFLISSSITLGKQMIQVDASFSSVDGLVIGADVKIAGVKIGEVTSIKINPKTFNADVSFTVMQGLKIPVDSSASIQSSGLIGAKYIAIEAGFEEKFITTGNKITMTTGSINIEKLVNTFASGFSSK